MYSASELAIRRRTTIRNTQSNYELVKRNILLSLRKALKSCWDATYQVFGGLILSILVAFIQFIVFIMV